MPNKTEIGRIDKVSISDLSEKSKKLLEVPLFLYRKSIRYPLPEEYDNNLNQFYAILVEWIKQISEKIGTIQKIYVESITKTLEKARSQLRSFLRNNQLLKIIEDLLESGAQLEQTDDAALLDEYLAWVEDANSADALEIDFKYVIETKKERASFISNKIKDTLSEGQLAIFFITPDLDPFIIYPQDIEIIKFRPPVVDDIIKFLSN
ncbi:MAG TPA: hypothetical protein VMV49_18900 [Candidatus Deferrimicrobium sp.]|nr:hypothetical protein [Candidatus Deferrimicrobium sp.]